MQLTKLVLTLAAGAFLALSAQAADPTGTWTWTRPARGGGDPTTMKLTLKADGEKLTGTLTSPGQNGATTDTAIADGKIKGDEISFTVTREFNGNKMVTKYTGTVTAETIKGQTEMERNGQTNKRDWEAKKEKK